MTITEELGEGGFKVAYGAEISGKLEALKLIQVSTDPEDATVLGFGLDRKSGTDHLEPLREGIHVFKERTGLG